MCSIKIIKKLSPQIIKFYYNSGRNFPWRQNRTPYRVYLSEVLLQRTQASQVTPVFHALVEKYTSIYSLANNFKDASILMKSLGRFSRFKYFEKGLKYLTEHFDGQIPQSKKDLLSVPSIGPYIAAAIRIFSFDLKDTIIDTNIVRVLGRIYGLKITPETRRDKQFIELAERQVPDREIIAYSYGLLDFAFLVCHPKKPLCDLCKLISFCKYYNEHNKC